MGAGSKVLGVQCLIVQPLSGQQPRQCWSYYFGSRSNCLSIDQLLKNDLHLGLGIFFSCSTEILQVLSGGAMPEHLFSQIPATASRLCQTVQKALNCTALRCNQTAFSVSACCWKHCHLHCTAFSVCHHQIYRHHIVEMSLQSMVNLIGAVSRRSDWMFRLRCLLYNILLKDPVKYWKWLWETIT